MVLSPRHRARLLSLVLAVVALGAPAAQAQISPSIPTPADIQAASQAQAAAQAVATRGPRPTADALTLEGPVDPDTYIVGPGDVFVASIGGSIPRQIRAVVSADGVLVIPEAGSFRVAGRSLAAAQRLVRPALQRRFLNVPTDVTLSSPRRFYVHVAGAVGQPGRHAVLAVARLEEAIAAAEGNNLAYGDLGVENGAMLPAFRNVTLHRVGEPERRIDFARYYATAEAAYNPYLRDGDRIRVPSFDPTQDGVFVGGAVTRPGSYDTRPDDTVLDLLTVAGADPEALDGARLVTATGERVLTLAEAARTPVGPREQVFAVRGDPERGVASVEGAVRFPGLYPIRSGTTTVGDLVETAGGLLPGALADAAYLERPLLTRDGQGTGWDASGLRADGLDLFSRTYLETEAARVPRVADDIAGAVRGAAPVPLVDGDRLVVPRNAEGIRMLGAVARPGYLPYREGQNAQAYIANAGGLLADSSSVFVIDAATGRLTPSTGAPLGLGDAVFVAPPDAIDSPELAQLSLQQQAADREARRQELEERRDEREERRDTRQARYQLIQTVISAVGVVATVLITVSALNQSSSN